MSPGGDINGRPGAEAAAPRGTGAADARAAPSPSEGRFSAGAPTPGRFATPFRLAGAEGSTGAEAATFPGAEVAVETGVPAAGSSLAVGCEGAGAASSADDRPGPEAPTADSPGPEARTEAEGPGALFAAGALSTGGPAGVLAGAPAPEAAGPNTGGPAGVLAGAVAPGAEGPNTGGAAGTLPEAADAEAPSTGGPEGGLGGVATPGEEAPSTGAPGAGRAGAADAGEEAPSTGGPAGGLGGVAAPGTEALSTGPGGGRTGAGALTAGRSGAEGRFGVAAGTGKAGVAPPFAAGTAIPGRGGDAGRAMAGIDCW